MTAKKSGSNQKEKTVTNPPQKTPDKSIIIKYLTIAGFSVLSILIALIALFGIANIVYAQKIYPQVYINDTNIGGLTSDQAKLAVAEAVDNYQSEKIIIKLSDGRSFTKDINDLGFNPDVDKTVENAILIGRDRNWLKSLSQMGSLIIRHYQLPVEGAYSAENIDSYIHELTREVDITETDATLTINKGKVTKIDEKNGVKLDNHKLKKLIVANLENLSSSPVEIELILVDPRVYREGLDNATSQVEQMIGQNIILKADNRENIPIDTDQIGQWLDFQATQEKVAGGRGVYLKATTNRSKLKAYAKAIAQKIDKKALDAKLTISGGKAVVFQPSQSGEEVEQDKLVDAIAKSIENQGDKTVLIPIKISKPQVSDSEINSLGINDLVGEATTSFAKSPDNRIHNIQNGAQFLNGQLIKPGDTYSVIQSLGAIDDSTGYLPELVIKENKTIPEFGGGLCQVSTTLFRAALDAGLPIAERQNHSWRISYYEPPVGLDATIYFPKPDLKIKNDTPGWILIQNNVDDNTKKITFQLYGTKDGRTHKIIGPTLLYSTPAPENIYTDDPGMPAGQEKRIQAPHPGGKATATYQVFDKNGKKVNEQTFVSIYKAAAAQFTRGTGAPAEAPPADQPAQ